MDQPQVIFCHDKFNINVYHAYFWARFEGFELGLGQVGSLRDFIQPSSTSENLRDVAPGQIRTKSIFILAITRFEIKNIYFDIYQIYS